MRQLPSLLEPAAQFLYRPLFQDTGTISSQDESESSSSKVDHKTDELSNLAYKASPQRTLASTTSAVVVTVNYRLGDIQTTTTASSADTPLLTKGLEPLQPLTSHKYPTPVHDTLSGFDWIQSTLNPSRLTVFGTHIGASLALMLSLTEARSIQAVAAIEPICDWPSLDEYCIRETDSVSPDPDQELSTPPTPKHKRHPRKKAAPPDLVPLLHAREKFFSSPERYFDSFASPILFLRSAGRDVPRSFPQYLTGPGYPVPVLKESGTEMGVYEMDSMSGLDPGVYSDVEGTCVDDEGGSGTVPRRRKALSRWPPYGLDYGLSGGARSRAGVGTGVKRLETRLPLVKVLVRDGVGEVKRKGREGGGGLVLRRQADEMVSAMRRACFWGREKGVGERRVGLDRVEGLHVADEEVGGWLGRVFRGDMDDLD
ncbi:Alpha/beta hydrolase fold-3 [Penicillium bovifimosum]|uniref:Alpha/beta hydrolase fold-3 n=1 Tax=Penicillium bovifimosum TaxID=126998 RepID=A0A9W9GTH5_9EURO|nr:Alpha/beta hydrolase fold-3 [Penicillium bovifimosum]KAJ5129613.1 Alpha/beta hydrolase fold-3 [Penicillium bovifimosum]